MAYVDDELASRPDRGPEAAETDGRAGSDLPRPRDLTRSVILEQ